ncbi:hypothetical protein D3C80_1914330 [compost metagenome]
MLFSAGVHVPLTPLVDVAGKGLKDVPAHTGPIAVNVGATIGFTVMVMVVVVAHCPAVGVNV